MNILDIIILLPVAWFGYKGFSKGFFLEAASLVALLLGIWAAIHFSYWIAQHLASWFGSDWKYLPLTSFLIVFLLVVIVVHLIAKALTKASSKAALGTINKFAGLALGAAKVLVIFGVLIAIINRYDPEGVYVNDEVKKGSLIYVPLNNAVVKIYPSVEEKFGEWKLSESAGVEKKESEEKE